MSGLWRDLIAFGCERVISTIHGLVHDHKDPRDCGGACGVRVAKAAGISRSTRGGRTTRIEHIGLQFET